MNIQNPMPLTQKTPEMIEILRVTCLKDKALPWELLFSDLNHSYFHCRNCVGVGEGFHRIHFLYAQIDFAHMHPYRSHLKSLKSEHVGSV